MNVPWERKTVEMRREEFVTRVLGREKSKSALCREYGISRPTGDKWVRRYEAGKGLGDQSKAPFHTPRRIDAAMEALIIGVRKKEPALGAGKIHRMLLNDGQANLPCISTVNAVLKRNNLITQEASQAAMPYKRFEKASSNVMWQADFKGHYALGNGQRCHPLIVIDDHSRFCLCAEAKADERREGVEESFRKIFEEYGLPEILLCDNGNPWGTSQSVGYTATEVRLMEHGILTIHIAPRHPRTQGKVERFNGSFKKERLKFYIAKDFEDAQRQFDEYRKYYNNVRPHYALELEVPAAHYEPSKRKYEEKVREWEYGRGYELRKVKSSGYFNYNDQGYYLSEGFREKTIAVQASTKDGIMKICYRQFVVGRIDLRERAIVSRRSYLMENDPRSLYTKGK